MRRTPSLAHGIIKSLRASIMDGAFELGEPLSEDALAEVFSVSRTPVREALKALRAEGIVDIVPKSGTYVFDPAPKQVLELCSFRLQLETWAIEQALLVAPKEISETLTDILIHMEEAITHADRSAYNRLDTQFHTAAFIHCGNRYLQEAYDAVTTQISALRAHLSTWRTDAVTLSMQEHAQIVEYARSRNVDELAHVLGEHINRAGETYVEALSDRARHQRNPSKRTRLREILGRHLSPEHSRLME